MFQVLRQIRLLTLGVPAVRLAAMLVNIRQVALLVVVVVSGDAVDPCRA